MADKVYRLTESELSEIIKESVKKVLDETSRRQKAMQSIYGKNKRVHTIGIITAENPMGVGLSKEENSFLMDNLLKNLKIGGYRYFKVKGQYGNEEHSLLVYNIGLDELQKLCVQYNQESAIFVDMQNGENVSYQYWENKNGKMQLVDEQHEIINAENFDDFYTQVARKFKFHIPFVFENCVKEHIKEINEALTKKEDRYDVDRLIVESLNPKYTGKHRYICRGKLYCK